MAVNRRAAINRTLAAAVALIVGGLLAPAWAEEAPFVVVKGSGDARALDLAIPGLGNLTSEHGVSTCDKAPESCGQTFGATAVKFSANDGALQDPTYAAGFASGQCGLLGSSPDPTNTNLCPDSSSTEFSYAPSSSNQGDDTPSCERPLSLPGGLDEVLQAKVACGNSKSLVVSAAPVSNNGAGIATVDFTIDLSALIPEVAGAQSQTDQAEQLKDEIITTLAGTLDQAFTLIQGAYDTVKGTNQTVEDNGGAVDETIEKLKEAIDFFLERAKDGSKAISINTGVSTTDVIQDNDVTKVIGQAAGATVGLLGLSDPLKDGLLIITTSASKAEVDINRLTSRATAIANPVLVTVKARDLLDLVEGDYLTCTISLTSSSCLGLPSLPDPGINTALDSILSRLEGTPLETDIKVLPSHADPPGPQASASVGGVQVWALKGLGATNASFPDHPQGDLNGGVQAKLGPANALGSITSVLCEGPCGKVTNGGGGNNPLGGPGDAPGAPVETNLPLTGGPTRFLFGLALTLVIGVPIMLLLGRKLRASA